MIKHTQMSIFDCGQSVKKISKNGVLFKLFIDGASRKNPGHSGAGLYLIQDNVVYENKGFYLGIKTNNQAEYLALLLGIFYARSHLNATDVLHIISDSELLIKQLKGEYKVKNVELKLLYDCAIDLLDGINYVFCHVLREYNKEADLLANHGIDTKKSVPKSFLTILTSHGINF